MQPHSNLTPEKQEIMSLDDFLKIISGSNTSENDNSMRTEIQSTSDTPEKIIELTNKNLGKIEITEETSLVNCNLSNLNLKESNFVNSSILRSNFVNSDLTEMVFDNTEINASTFINVDLRCVRMSSAEIIETKFQNSNLSDISFMNSTLNGVSFENVNLTKVEFEDTKIINSSLQHVDLTGANLIDSSFEDSDLTGANFHSAALIKVDFKDTILIGANFEKCIESTMNKIDFKESENFSSLIYLLENLGRDEIKKFLGIQENGTSEALRFLLEKNEMLPLIIQKDDHDRLTPFIDFIAKVEEKVREIAPKEIQLAEESAPKRARTDGGSRNDSSKQGPSPSPIVKNSPAKPARDSSTQASSFPV